MIFEKNDKIVFAGDSVTDMGSVCPCGERLGKGLGEGYPNIIDSLLASCYPELNIRVINSGISGNTSRDLLARFDTTVLNHKPDWISICIGINDVWRQFDSPCILDFHISPEEYAENLEKMIVSSKAECKGVIVCTPYYIENLREDKMRARMDEYSAICKKLAEKYGCIFVDFQTMYENYCQICHSSSVAWDRVHPNQIGSTLMAKEILKHCGFDFNHN
ncbi:MAG: GDSL family lipase [Ruminococcaceae bacterium]|nr:GDSL family lipase [Oscillospiraceae bacterium]